MVLHSIALALIAVVTAGQAPAGAPTGSLGELVAEGERWWTTSPLPDAERAALAITAYLTARSTGEPVSPGIVAGQPVFEGRLQALAESVGRGARLYACRCESCHDPGAVAPAALLFPRAVNGQVESLERFLGRHRPDVPSLGPDAPATADVIAFLMSGLAGRPVGSP